jgi:Uncharacterized conserved protein (COG2071)
VTNGAARALRRHRIPMATHLQHCLVLAYAWPRQLLEPLIPPELELDTYQAGAPFVAASGDGSGGGSPDGSGREFAFVAVALVRAEGLRPRGFPRGLGGGDHVLTGYGIFVRWRAADPPIRGLFILRSDTDSDAMVRFGTLLARQPYGRAEIRFEERPEAIEIEVATPRAEADLHVVADLTSRPAPLPPESPFRSLHDARRFAGPLAHSFLREDDRDGGAERNGEVVMIQGMRSSWEPQPIAVDVRDVTFFDAAPFAGVEPTLANAFHASDVEYVWERSRRLAAAARPATARSRVARRWAPRPGEVPQPS